MVRTLYCILTRGGVLKSLFPDSADAGMLISLFSAIIHDYEHKGVNVRGRVFRLGRPSPKLLKLHHTVSYAASW